MSTDRASDAEIAAALEALTSRLRGLLGASLDRLVLFGSRARGDYDSRSDVDVAVIVRGLDSGSKRRILDLVADVELEYLSDAVSRPDSEYHHGGGLRAVTQRLAA